MGVWFDMERDRLAKLSSSTSSFDVLSSNTIVMTCRCNLVHVHVITVHVIILHVHVVMVHVITVHVIIVHVHVITVHVIIQ